MQPRKIVPPIQRLIARLLIDQSSKCWMWLGAANEKGYGVIGLGVRRVGSTHRLAYQHFTGPIPAGMELHHLCGKPPCCNPAHLVPVLPALHPGTFSAVNSPKTHCPKGHPLSGENLYITPSTGHRSCQTCRRVARAASNADREYHREYLRKWRAARRALKQ